MNNPINIVMNKEKKRWQPEITQDGMAVILGVTRQTVVNYINNPESIPASVLMKLSLITGMPINELCGRDEIESNLNIMPSYNAHVEGIRECIKKAKEGVDALERRRKSIPEEDTLNSCRLATETCINQLNDVISTITQLGRKPTVCVCGLPYTGKSTLINYLIGKEILPVGHGPMTMVPTYIMHVGEKPEFLGTMSEADNTIVVGRKRGMSKDKISYFQSGFGDVNLDDIIRIGNHESIIKEFGTQEGVYFDDSDYQVDEIYVFADADILKEVTFVDFPGFGVQGESKDTELVLETAAFDIIFYLSTAADFLNNNDLMSLSNILSSRKEDGTFYVLATHAYSLKAKDQKEKKEENPIETGAKRVIKTMPDSEKPEISEDEKLENLMKRCFWFDISNEKHRQEVNDRLEEEIPEIINKRITNAEDQVKMISYGNINLIETLLKSLQDGREGQINAKSEKRKTEDFVQIITEENLQKLEEKIKSDLYHATHIMANEVESKYKEVIDKDFIKKAIDKKAFNNRKTDHEALGTYLSEEISNCFKESIRKNSYIFADDVNSALRECKENINFQINAKGLSVDYGKFDFVSAFAKGLSETNRIGALKVWDAAVKMGHDSENTLYHGKRKIGTKAVYRKPMDIIGTAISGAVAGATGAAGVVGATSGIAFLPIGLAGITIGMAFGIKEGIAGYGVITGKWEDRLAKRIVNTYEEKNVLDGLLGAIENYGQNTINAIDNCMNQLSEQIKKYNEDAVNILTIDDRMYYRVLNTDMDTYNMCKSVYSDMLDALEKNN